MKLCAYMLVVTVPSAVLIPRDIFNLYYSIPLFQIVNHSSCSRYKAIAVHIDMHYVIDTLHTYMNDLQIEIEGEIAY